MFTVYLECVIKAMNMYRNGIVPDVGLHGLRRNFRFMGEILKKKEHSFWFG